jgi:hypothetical protein
MDNKWWKCSNDEWWYEDEWIFEDSEEIENFIIIGNLVRWNFEQEADYMPFELDDTIIKLLTNGGYTGVELRCYGNFPLNNLPNTIEKLFITDSCEFNQPLDNLPSGLKQLKIESNVFSQSLDNLPVGLEELHLHIYELQDLYHLPAGLKKLTLRICNNLIRYNIILPKSLEELTTNLEMYRNCDKDLLPKGLKKLL